MTTSSGHGTDLLPRRALWDISDEQAEILVNRVCGTVKTIMSKAPFDSSHDFHHVERVLSLANEIAASERHINPGVRLNPVLITLTALLHDVGDLKYVADVADVASLLTAEEILLMHGAPALLASAVQLLTANVSFSQEQKNPDGVKALILQYPELAIVQDADRLDALGAVGVARAFIFNGVRGRPLSEARLVFDTRLLPREGAMKTQRGKKLAAERCDFLRQFMAQWDFETTHNDVKSLNTNV